MSFLPISATRRFWLAIVCVLLFASACGEVPATAPTAPPPQSTGAPPAAAVRTAVPATATSPVPAAATAAPEPSAVPAVATTAPPAGGLLPAPLYFLADNQIWRMERDGKTKRQLTFESAPIIDFDVDPSDGALAYLIGEQPQGTIVLLDAGGRTELMNGPVSSPLFAPGGEQIAFQLSQPLDGLQIGRDKGSDTGVWTIARAGGRPGLLQASEPISDTENPPTDARQYFPIAFSPDGTRLLLGGYFPAGEGGFIAVKRLSDGKLIEISDGCCQAAWSVDGSAVLIAGGTQIQDAYLGLWRADPDSGQATPLIDATKTNGSPLVTAAQQLRVGTIYAFAAISADPAFDRPNEVLLQRVAAGGALEPVRKEQFTVASALWAEDGRGVVVIAETQQADRPEGELQWAPADAGAITGLAVRGSQLRWGPAQPKPQADACARFRPIAWQPPASRQARPEALDAQRRLLALGYSQLGQADGLYGDQTRAAVIAFQQASRIAASGEIDCATWGALLAGAK